MSKNYKGSNNKSENNKRYSKGKDKYTKNNKDYKNRADKEGSYKDNSERVVGLSGGNHPSWYTVNSTLVDGASRIPWGYIAGKPLTLTSSTGHTRTNVTVPGVMALEYIPIPGIGESSDDGFNIAAQNVYQYIRKNLSTQATYQPADIMMMFMAIDGIYMQIANLTRLYGLINAWNADNYYLPYDIIHAGYKLSRDEIYSLQKNQNEFRSALNSLIYKTATLYTPVSFTIFDRHNWLFSNIFKDSDATGKAQFYISRLYQTPLLIEDVSTEGTMLEYEVVVSRTTNQNTWNNFLNILNESIEYVRNSDSFNQIMADMKRAYGDEVKTWSLTYIPEGYIVSVTDDPYYKEQLHNSVILGASRSAGIVSYDESTSKVSAFRITQSVDHNVIISKPYIRLYAEDDYGITFNNAALFTGERLLNLYTSDTSQDMCVEITRNIPTCTPLGDWDGSSTDRYMRVESAGADLILNAYIYRHNPDPKLDPDETRFEQLINTTTTGLTTDKLGVDIVLLYTATPFYYCPMMYMMEENTTTDTSIVPITEFDNYGKISDKTLKLMNDAISTSMWAVPVSV
jgi:hypothetical protein